MKKTLSVLFLILVFSNVQAQKGKQNLIIGTYTKGCESKGIYVYDFDAESGDFHFKNESKLSDGFKGQ